MPNLLARKQKLIDRLNEKPEAAEREDLERQLNQVNTALDMLGRFEPKASEG